MRSSPAAQPSQNGCVSGVGTGTGLAATRSLPPLPERFSGITF
jgi:hypothetical protein